LPEEFDSNGVATGADAQRRRGRPWNPARRQPPAPYTSPDAGGRPWNPAETNSQSAGRRFESARRLQNPLRNRNLQARLGGVAKCGISCPHCVRIFGVREYLLAFSQYSFEVLSAHSSFDPVSPRPVIRRRTNYENGQGRRVGRRHQSLSDPRTRPCSRTRLCHQSIVVLESAEHRERDQLPLARR